MSSGKVWLKSLSWTVTFVTTCPVRPVTVIVAGYGVATVGGVVLSLMMMLGGLENVRTVPLAASGKRRQRQLRMEVFINSFCGRCILLQAISVVLNPRIVQFPEDVLCPHSLPFSAYSAYSVVNGC